MAFEAPLLVVSRPVAACSRCKTAKTRCDGKLPACTACEKAGKASQCSSRTDDEFARGRERSYVATLEARIEKLKYRLAQAGRSDRLQALHLPPNHSVSSRPPSAQDDHPSPASSDQRLHPRAAKQKEQDDIENLVSNFGVMTVNAAARDFQGFSSAMSYARLMLAAATVEPLPAEVNAHPLPSRNDLIRFAAHYFAGVYAFLPFFEESTFWRAVDQLYSHTGYATPQDQWQVRMVAAIGLISQSEKYLDQFHLAAMAHLKAALAFAEQAIHPGSIPSIQAIIFLIQYARYDPCHFDDWTLVGAVARAMADLGIHQDPPKPSAGPKSKLLLRRKLFYVIYCLDRSTSIAYDRAFSFSDDGSNVAFPAASPPPNRYPPSPDFTSAKQATDGLGCLVRLRRIQSQCYQDLYQTGREAWPDPYPYIWQKWHEISDWRLRSTHHLSPWAATLANIELLCTNIYLLAPSPRVPHIDELAQSLIFELSIGYTELVQAALREPTCRAWVQQAEAIKALKVGKIFVRNLSAFRTRLVAGTLPNVPSSPQHTSLTPPPFPYPPRSDNLDRALTFIHQMTEILEAYATRFGTNELLREFSEDTRGMVIDLSAQSPMDWRGSFSFASYVPPTVSY